MRPVDVQPGDRYGVMTVVAEAPRGRSGSRWQRRVLVSCDCGAQVTRMVTGGRAVRAVIVDCDCGRRGVLARGCSPQCPVQRRNRRPAALT